MKTMQGRLLIPKSLHGNPGWLPYRCCQFAMLTWVKTEKGLSFLTLPLSSPPPCWFFPICNINWLVKVADRWKAHLIIEIVRSKEIESICHTCQFTANAGPGQTQMRGRWGGQTTAYGSDKAVGDIKGQRGGAGGWCWCCGLMRGAWSLSSQT